MTMIIEGRPLSDYVERAPLGWSSHLSWVARNIPCSLNLLDLPEGLDEGSWAIIHEARKHRIMPKVVQSSVVMQECGIAKIAIVPEWVIASYYDEGELLRTKGNGPEPTADFRSSG